MVIDEKSPLHGRKTKEVFFNIPVITRGANKSTEVKREVTAKIKRVVSSVMDDFDLEKFTGPVMMDVTIYFSPLDFPSGSVVSVMDSWCGDIDNHQKVLYDGLKGELFSDDVLITDTTVRKRVSGTKESYIRVHAIGSYANEHDRDVTRCNAFSHKEGQQIVKVLSDALEKKFPLVALRHGIPTNGELLISLSDLRVLDEGEEPSIPYEAGEWLVDKIQNEGVLDVLDAFISKLPHSDAKGEFCINLKKFP